MHRRTASFLAAAALAATFATNANAQAVRVTAANASNGQIYDVTFSGSSGTATILNTDQNAHVSIRSLAYVPNNISGQIDLLAADTLGGQLLFYANAQGNSQVLWQQSYGVAHPSEGAGPVSPDGISVDAKGNLFVTSSAPGNSTNAEVWVLPHDGGPLPGGYSLPLLVDRNFGGASVRLLEESLSVQVTVGPGGLAAGLGDLLVLASDPAAVFDYSSASIASVLAGHGPVSSVTMLLTPSHFPAKEAPGGMDYWPVDGTLLVTTSRGRILRFGANGNSLADFASGLGNGMYKVRAGYEFSTPLAVVADNNGGDIVKFGAPPPTGSNLPLATVTMGVEHPQGLVVSNLGVSAAASCLQSANGCNPLGSVIKHTISHATSATGSVFEQPCVVQIDPRIAQYGSCRGHTLNVANVCAGYDNITIPDYLCGASGASGRGFALVNTSETHFLNSLNSLVANEAFAQNVIGDGPPCPTTVLGWAPKADEGEIVEGAAMLELTGGCGSSTAFSRSLSIWGIGLALDVGALPGKNTMDKLVNFAASKYSAIGAVVTSASTLIADATETQLRVCLSDSRDYFDRKKYLNAAGQLLACDQLIAQNPGAFSASSANPNPSGELRGRIANLYLTINSRILGNAPNATWPPTN